jgi:hypothetical protein
MRLTRCLLRYEGLVIELFSLTNIIKAQEKGLRLYNHGDWLNDSRNYFSICEALCRTLMLLCLGSCFHHRRQASPYPNPN